MRRKVGKDVCTYLGTYLLKYLGVTDSVSENKVELT
jgi:hypothetical protein